MTVAAQSASALTLVMTAALLLLVLVSAVLFLRARRALDAELDAATDFGADREAQSRYLIEHWASVEQTARAQGMTDEQLADVKRRLLENVG